MCLEVYSDENWRMREAVIKCLPAFPSAVECAVMSTMRVHYAFIVFIVSIYDGHMRSNMNTMNASASDALLQF